MLSFAVKLVVLLLAATQSAGHLSASTPDLSTSIPERTSLRGRVNLFQHDTANEDGPIRRLPVLSGHITRKLNLKNRAKVCPLRHGCSWNSDQSFCRCAQSIYDMGALMR